MVTVVLCDNSCCLSSFVSIKVVCLVCVHSRPFPKSGVDYPCLVKSSYPVQQFLSCCTYCSRGKKKPALWRQYYVLHDSWKVHVYLTIDYVHNFVLWRLRWLFLLHQRHGPLGAWISCATLATWSTAVFALYIGGILYYTYVNTNQVHGPLGA